MPNQVCSESKFFEKISPNERFVDMGNPFIEAIRKEVNFPEARTRGAAPSYGDVKTFMDHYGSRSFTREDMNSVAENHPDGKMRRTAGFFQNNFDKLTRLSVAGGSTDKLTSEDLNLYKTLLSVNEKETPRAKQAVNYLKENFAKIDADCSGNISQEEIRNLKPKWGQETQQFAEMKKYLEENYSVLSTEVRTGFLWNTTPLITKDTLRDGAVDKLVENKFRKAHYDSELRNYSFIPIAGGLAGGMVAGQRSLNLFEQNLKPIYSSSGYRLDNPRKSMYLALAGIAAGAAAGSLGGSWIGNHVNEWWNGGNVQHQFNNQALPATRDLIGRR